jgi:hypothetical protein
MRPTGAIDITYDVLTQKNIQVFSNALLGLLSDLELNAEQSIEKSADGTISGAYIKSAAGVRNSRILPKGWREALDLDIDVRVHPGGVWVQAVAHVMVCREALTNLVDYSGTDDAQRALYATSLDTRINAALKKVCTTTVQRDSKTLTCD